MVESFDVRREAAAVLGVDLDLIMGEPGFGGFADGNGYASICGPLGCGF